MTREEGVIPLHPIAPTTDEEWAAALSLYACDRGSPSSPYTSPADSSFPPCGLYSPSSSAPLAGPSRPVLRHEDSGDSLDADASARSPDGAGQTCSRPPAAADYINHSTASSSPTTRRPSAIPCERQDSASSCGSHAAAASSSTEPGKLAFGIADTVRSPDEERKQPGAACEAPAGWASDRRSAEEERMRMREFYERNGFLCAPEPSRHTYIRRTRAIRRLGLCCWSAEELPERKAVMCKYAELTKQVLNADRALVSFMKDDMEVAYRPDPAEATEVRPSWDTAAAHAINFAGDHAPMVVADLENDWRFRMNPHRVRYGVKFMVAVPLRFEHKGVAVNIGALCAFSDKPRETLDRRECDMLLNLANLLIYQLTTLQSEIIAKRSSSMYEASISFLRRSVMPEDVKARRDASSTKEAKKSKESTLKPETTAEDRSRLRRPSPSSTDLSSPLSRESTSRSRTEIPPAIKTGPRDSKDAKRKQMNSDRQLFTDAAETLRRILGADAVAMVSMDEFQLFIRRTDVHEPGGKRGKNTESKERIIGDFLEGKPWPAHIEPVVHYVPKTSEGGVQVLGTSAAEGSRSFHFDRPGVESSLGDFLRVYLKTRHFWWDREDADDELSQRIMDLMPEGSQTTLATSFMTHDGKTRFATFASWDRAPSTFGDSSTIALPFAWILGGCAMAALAIRKVRTLEQSQISYSNLQAHELRTPLHQILAITQLLRSAMMDLADVPHNLEASSQQNLPTTQQIRDLLPLLDAIDTSGKTLHGIVDNILSFLDLRGKDQTVMPSSPSFINSPTGAVRSLEVMFEELIQEACEEDQRSRRANGREMCHTETVFEIIPPLLGEQVTEDTGGALRRAMAKILSNAYKFIEGEGCVEIYVDDVPSLLPPEGCEDLSLSKRVSIKIVDNGRGMDRSFVNEKLGEPWAKEDLYATGSGLSVHLAYRIIDLMGGQMEISSAPGKGCTVTLEIPLPRRHLSVPNSPQVGTSPDPQSPTDPTHLAVHPDNLHVHRKVAFAGFDSSQIVGLRTLGECLERQFHKLGCDVVPLEDAELVILDGRLEERAEGAEVLDRIRTDDIVYLVTADHEAHSAVIDAQRRTAKAVRRFRKPATPSALRESLFPDHGKAIKATIPTQSGSRLASLNSPEHVDRNGLTTSEPGSPHSDTKRQTRVKVDESTLHKPPAKPGLVAGLSGLWKPKNMEVEDAVACLCLGDYFSARRRNLSRQRTPSNASSAHDSSGPDSHSHDPSVTDVDMDHPEEVGSESEPEPEPEPPERVKVIVVEDNVVNRRILVRILNSKLDVDVIEAEDGLVAVAKFKELSGPAIVLLDINMPKMDGYQACIEMRSIEKSGSQRGKSQIIAVTALAGEAEKRRGLVECGMDDWLTKPCGKATIQTTVENARKLLMGLSEAFDKVEGQAGGGA